MLPKVLLAMLVASAAVGLEGSQHYGYWPWYYPWYYPAAALQRGVVVVEGEGVPVYYPYVYPYRPAGLQKGSFVTAEGPGGSSVLHEGVAYQVGEQFKHH